MIKSSKKSASQKKSKNSLVRDAQIEEIDRSLRPESLDDFIGQQKIKDNLSICLEAAQKRKDSLDHFLLYGSPGIGKTSLAHIIAKEMRSNIKITSGPVIKKAGDLAAILTSLKRHDILFIDEIHRLSQTVEEILYPALEDFKLDLILGKGPSAKSLQLDLPPFTLVGATTKIGALSSPLRTRFGHIYRLNYYEEQDIQKIVLRSARLLKIALPNDAALEIAKRSRRTPRIANRLLRRVRDYAEVKGDGYITSSLATEALELLEVDNLGLDEVDRRLLKTLIEKFSGGPTGLSTLAHATSEEKETIEEVYEPFLLQLGFLDRTPKGRIATLEAYHHLNIKPQK